MALYGKKSCSYRISSFSNNFINLIIENDNNISWRLFGLYDFPEHRRRKDS